MRCGQRLDVLDVAAAEHRDADRLLDPGDLGPVGGPLVLLAAGPAVHGDRRDAGVLQRSRQLGGVDRGRVPSEAHLHGDRDTRTASTIAADHPGGRAHVAGKRGAAAPADHLGHRAAEVDVDEHGAALDADLGGVGHHRGIAADQLGRDRRHLAREIEQMQRRVGAAHHRLGGDHLGRHQAGAELAAELAAGRVGDADHGRHQHR